MLCVHFPLLCFCSASSLGSLAALIFFVCIHIFVCIFIKELNYPCTHLLEYIFVWVVVYAVYVVYVVYVVILRNPRVDDPRSPEEKKHTHVPVFAKVIIIPKATLA